MSPSPLSSSPRNIPSTMLFPREYPDTSDFIGARRNTKRYARGIEVNGGELESEWTFLLTFFLSINSHPSAICSYPCVSVIAYLQTLDARTTDILATCVRLNVGVRVCILPINSPSLLTIHSVRKKLIRIFHARTLYRSLVDANARLYRTNPNTVEQSN